MKPGIYSDIERSKYDDDPCPEPSLNQTVAKVLVQQSPAHAWLACPRLNAGYIRESKSAFDIGTAAHALLFEGKAPVVVEADNFRTKEAQKARDEFGAILPRQAANVHAMVAAAKRAIESNKELQIKSLADGRAEQTVIWQPADKSIWCRSRLDWFHDGLILDYKTTTDARPSNWLRSAMKLGIDVQAAFYFRAMKQTINVEPKFVFVVQETEPPFAVSFIGADPSMIELGDRKIDYAMTKWGDCLKSGEWPAYDQRIQWAAPPAWATAEWDTAAFNRLPRGEDE